jgi:hypothetical protein
VSEKCEACGKEGTKGGTLLYGLCFTCMESGAQWAAKMARMHPNPDLVETPHCPTCTCAKFDTQVETLAQMIKTALKLNPGGQHAR